MKQNSKRLMSIIVALAFVVVALIIFFDLVQPAYGNLMMAKGQVAATEDLLQSESSAVTQAQKIISEYSGQSGVQQSVSFAVPADQDMAGALAQIYGLAQNNGLSIQSISISAPTLQARPAASSSIVKPIGNISLQVSAEGTYEALDNFVQGLETNIRIFDLKGLTISPASVAASGKNAGGQDFFNYSITITTYYQTK